MDCPHLLQFFIKILTRRISLGHYQNAARKGMSNQDCHIVYHRCRKSNLEILSQLFPQGGRNKKARNFSFETRNANLQELNY